MFTTYNVASPFYLTNNFDYTSDSESDEDIYIMSNITKQSTAASKVHHALKVFFQANQIPAAIYAENQTTVRTLFGADQALWAEYKKAESEYKNDGTDKQRLDCANAISSAAIKIRQSNSVTAMTVTSVHTPIVHLQGLSLQEVEDLNELHKLMIAKMQGEGKSGNAGMADQMLVDFMDDMELAKKSGMLADKWYQSHRMWKMSEHFRQKHNKELKYEKTTNEI